MRTGRPRALTREQHIELWRRVNAGEWREGFVPQVAAEFGVSKNTIRNYLGYRYELDEAAMEQLSAEHESRGRA